MTTLIAAAKETLFSGSVFKIFKIFLLIYDLNALCLDHKCTRNKEISCYSVESRIG